MRPIRRCAAIVYLAAGLLHAAESYRIAGMIANAVTAQPVSGARVTLTPNGHQDAAATGLSGEDGSFEFTGLGRGSYTLAGAKRGLLSASSVIVSGPGLDTESILLRLQPPGILSGKVVDDAGEPVAGALVELLGSRIVDGRRRLMHESVQHSDDTGAYRFAALAPGLYYVTVSGVPWYAKFNETMGDAAPPSMTRAGYGMAASEPLALQAGQESVTNFSLLPVQAAPVYVHCEAGEDLTKEYTVTTSGVEGSPVIVRQGSGTGDLFNLRAVPPGHYSLRVEAADGDRSWYGLSEFDAAGAELDVDVTLRAAPALSGAVVADGAGLPPRMSVILGDESGSAITIPVAADGRFSNPAIRPGRYHVSIAGGDDYHLRDRKDETLNVASGSAVRVRLAIVRGARLAGTVYRDGRPFAGALVVFSPANRAARTSSDGSFEFRGLPAGEYALFAVEDGADLEYANAAAVRPYLSGAKKVRIDAIGTDHVRLDIGK